MVGAGCEAGAGCGLLPDTDFEAVVGGRVSYETIRDGGRAGGKRRPVEGRAEADGREPERKSVTGTLNGDFRADGDDAAGCDPGFAAVEAAWDIGVERNFDGPAAVEPDASLFCETARVGTEFDGLTAG